MSLRLRKIDPVIATDRENFVERPGKHVTKNVVPKRPALGEINKNKLISQADNVCHKKPVEQQQGKRLNVKPELRKVQSKTTNATKVESAFKREESSLKPTVKAAVTQKATETSYSSKQLMGIADVDATDKDDPSLVTEYVQDIFVYLRTLETEFPIKKGYLTNHRTTPRMRGIVINWMVDVHINFKFMLETLHLSVSLLDRYLQKHLTIGRETLQLVGVTAIFIASKYEEMYTPDVSDFEYICDNSFSLAEILKMELDILLSLEFNLGRPLSIHFLRRFNKVAKVTADHHNLAKYLLEIFLLHHELCYVDPSLQAATACCLSISILGEVSDPGKVWTRTLVHYSSYKYTDIKPVMLTLASFLYKMDKSKFPAVREKYASASYGKISLNQKLQGPLVRKLVDQSCLRN